MACSRQLERAASPPGISFFLGRVRSNDDKVEQMGEPAVMMLILCATYASVSDGCCHLAALIAQSCDGRLLRTHLEFLHPASQPRPPPSLSRVRLHALTPAQHGPPIRGNCVQSRHASTSPRVGIYRGATAAMGGLVVVHDGNLLHERRLAIGGLDIPLPTWQGKSTLGLGRLCLPRA
jgi:hypothetical protein